LSHQSTTKNQFSARQLRSEGQTYLKSLSTWRPWCCQS